MGDYMENLKGRIELNTMDFCRVWYGLPCNITKELRGYDFNAQMENERYIESFMNTIYDKFLNFPNDEEEKIKWGKEIDRLIKEFANNSKFTNNRAINYLLSKNIKDITKEFFKKAKAFDDKMSLEEIGQAMRNVWIMNISQVILNMDVKFTNSIFAYSMLYPYTDNLLDDKILSDEYKVQISNKLKSIILGGNIDIDNDYENKLYELIGLIEGDFPRGTYKEVFESVLAIHEAQVVSLQQQEKEVSPFEKDMLNISFIKGGTSVLADGYLVKGNLSSEEIKFMLGYGIMLQLCDDLQDVKEDLKNNHMTIFSLTAKQWNLDNITNKLINFIDYIVYEELKDFKYEIKEDMDEFLKENCLMLAFLSMGNSKDYFSYSYIKNIEKHMPFRFSFLKSIGDNFRKKYAKIRKKYNEETFEQMIDYI